MISGFMDLKEIGIKIRKYREKAGLSQAQLGSLVGLGQSAINKIENGQNTTIKKLIEIAEILKIPLYEFFVEKPLVPYEDKEPILKFNMPEAELEGIKRTISLTIGREGKRPLLGYTASEVSALKSIP